MESSTKKTRSCPYELFRHRIEEIDSKLRKHDTGLEKKFCGQYGSGEKQKRSLNRDNYSLGEKQKGVEANNSSNSNKGGKWSKVQTVRAVSLESLEIEIGKKKKIWQQAWQRGRVALRFKKRKKKGRVSKSRNGGGWIPAPPIPMSILC